jgi:hypothetical protein
VYVARVLKRLTGRLTMITRTCHFITDPTVKKSRSFLLPDSNFAEDVAEEAVVFYQHFQTLLPIDRDWLP